MGGVAYSQQGLYPAAVRQRGQRLLPATGFQTVFFNLSVINIAT